MIKKWSIFFVFFLAQIIGVEAIASDPNINAQPSSKPTPSHSSTPAQTSAPKVDDSKTIVPALHLLRLQSLKTSDQKTDELYLSILTFESTGKPHHYQIPEFPLYWSSKNLDQIKNLKIWQNPLAVGQGVTLVLSLMEHDAPPWNSDDWIGSLKIQLRNNQGNLEMSWVVPNRAEGPLKVISKFGEAEKVDLTDGKGTYSLYFYLDPRAGKEPPPPEEFKPMPEERKGVPPKINSQKMPPTF